MKFYSYEEVKKLDRGEHLICLLCNCKNEYVGLAYSKSYPIRIRNLVCILVRSVKEDYLVPVGVSNEDEWAIQESEHQIKNVGRGI